VTVFTPATWTATAYPHSLGTTAVYPRDGVHVVQSATIPVRFRRKQIIMYWCPIDCQSTRNHQPTTVPITRRSTESASAKRGGQRENNVHSRANTALRSVTVFGVRAFLHGSGATSVRRTTGGAVMSGAYARTRTTSNQGMPTRCSSADRSDRHEEAWADRLADTSPGAPSNLAMRAEAEVIKGSTRWVDLLR